MKVSIYDVAKRSGLSVVTVSRVLNKDPSVREKNRQKVLQAMKELAYHPKAAARSLAKGRTGLVGMMISTLDDSFFDEVTKEISHQLAERGYYLTLSIVSGEEEDRSSMFFHEDHVDGVILLSPMNEISTTLELKERNIPYVLIDHQFPAPAVPTIAIDNYAGAMMAVNHLIELGHQEISFIGGPEMFLSSRERERGFRDAMERAGLTPFSIEPGDFQIASGQAAADRWIAAGTIPTGVFAADDHMALGVMDVCKSAGIRIPKDISIVGFDDQLFGSQFRPKLTTVRQPAERIGRKAVELLLERIEKPDGKEGEEPADILLTPELVIRESTSCPGGPDRKGGG